jgi:hypothetical protein
MIVNKTMRDIKKPKIQGPTLILIGCDKTDIKEVSAAVFFHHFVYPKESRGYPISFVAEGSRYMTTALPSVAFRSVTKIPLSGGAGGHPRFSIN